MKKPGLPLCAAIAFGVLLFAVAFPYSHNMYIPPLFTGICIFLNALSAALLAILLYKILARQVQPDDPSAFGWGLVLPGIGHGIFSMMNWGSWLFLGLSAAAVVYLFIVYLKNKQ